jgi:hypothetical protein
MKRRKRFCETVKKTPSLDIRTLRRAVEGLVVTGSQWILYGRDRRRFATRSRQNAMRLNCSSDAPRGDGGEGKGRRELPHGREGWRCYTFKKDTPVKSACAGDYVPERPPYHQEKVGVTGDLKASDFASITREDGKKQTTYKGMRLYFARDAAPGDTRPTS